MTAKQQTPSRKSNPNWWKLLNPTCLLHLMLQADALEALPPSRAFLFDVYFRDRGVGFVLGQSCIFNTLMSSARIRRGAASLVLAKIDIKYIQYEGKCALNRCSNHRVSVIRSSSARRFVGSPHRLLSRKNTPNYLRRVEPVLVRQPGRTITIVHTLRLSAPIRRGAASLALAKIDIKLFQFEDKNTVGESHCRVVGAGDSRDG